MKDDIVCALSGYTPSEEEEANELADLPDGWIEITVKRAFPNQRYMIVQQLKQQAVQMTLSQIPEEQREAAKFSIETQVNVNYHAYESSLKDYEQEEDVIYISPPENDDAVLKEYMKLSEMLGFDPMLFEDDEDEGDIVEEEQVEELKEESEEKET